MDARHAWRQRSMAAMASGVVGFCRANLRAQISLERYLTAAGRGTRGLAEKVPSLLVYFCSVGRFAS